MQTTASRKRVVHHCSAESSLSEGCESGGRIEVNNGSITTGGGNLTLETSTAQLFFSGSGLTFLAIFTLVGAVMAAIVFSISVVSIPMLLDRKIDFITAVLTSLSAVRANPAPMALWAALIATFTGIGLVTFYLGLVITLPLIGHATWHAYRDLVEDGDIEQQPL